MEELAVYLVEAVEPHGDLARSLEAETFSAAGGYSISFIEDWFGKYDGNSSFFVLVDAADPDDPSLVGALRVIDCSVGPSETVDFFRESFGADAEIPPAMVPDDAHRGLWDIMTVVVAPSHRNGMASAWLYHSLFRKATELGVVRWITNMTRREAHNLRDLAGIPFVEIEGAGEVVDGAAESPESAYRFYSIEVAEILPSVAAHIEAMEDGDHPDPRDGITVAAIARIARVALLGRTAGPVAP